MNKIYKGSAVFLSVILLFALCLTSIVFATDGENTPISDDFEASLDTSQPQDSDPPPQQTQATASTEAELLDWIQDKNSQGTLTLTSDITITNALVFRFSNVPITVDTGNYSITVTGDVELLCNKLTITGTGGTDGLIRVQSGGLLSLNYITVTASDNGTALYQEEGAGLFIDDGCTIQGNAKYAQIPLIWYWNKLPLVIVNAEETAQLPKTVSGQVNQNGYLKRLDVPVIWELDEHEQAQEQRRRFLAKGKVDGYVMDTPPVCTVAYNDFPLTFTSVKAKEVTNTYSVDGGFTKPEGALPIKMEEQYSFNGTDWITFDKRVIEKEYDGFSICMSKTVGQDDYWDISASPYLYIRLFWDDDTYDYFSNVLRFEGADFGAASDIGGNRGGGTDITNPPPIPDPVPPSNGTNQTPPSTNPDPTSPSNNSNTLPNSIADPKPTVSIGATVTPDPIPSANPSPSSIPSTPTSPSSTPLTQPVPTDPPNPLAEPPASPLHRAMPPDFSESKHVLATPQSEPVNKHKPVGLSIVVGFAAVAATIGAAGLFLHPQSLKRFSKLFKKLPKK